MANFLLCNQTNAKFHPIGAGMGPYAAKTEFLRKFGIQAPQGVSLSRLLQNYHDVWALLTWINVKKIRWIH